MVFDFDVIRDAKAETEMESMLAALRIDLPDVLSEQVSILKCVSGTTDHASTATQSMERLGVAKMQAWDELPLETIENTSQREQQIASDFKIRNCQSHFTNVLSMNCLASCIEACRRHAQPDDYADETMKHAYVTTDTIESAFGKLDQTNEQSQRVDIWKILARPCAVVVVSSLRAGSVYVERFLARRYALSMREINRETDT